MLMTLRRFGASERYVRAGRWPIDGPYPLTRDVTGSRVGILGLGRIGSAIADRLSAFKCDIAYHNRRERSDVGYRYASSPLQLAQHRRRVGGRNHRRQGRPPLVDRDVLEALGPDGYLINIARGSVVDEEALVELLAEEKLAGAGLDVFAHEPDVPERTARNGHCGRAPTCR